MLRVAPRYFRVQRITVLVLIKKGRQMAALYVLQVYGYATILG